MKQNLLFLGLISGALLLTKITTQNLTPLITVTSAQVAPSGLSLPIDACAVTGSYPDEVRQWCAFITTYAQQNDLDPNLIAALIWQESGGAPDIVSMDGAVGLMQIMPSDGKATEFTCVNGPCFANRPTTMELSDPEFNIAWGTAFLNTLHDNFGNIRDALKAYGPANVNYYYADKILNIYNAN
jgi:soluble lytic murein transglycosylase-like protein